MDLRVLWVFWSDFIKIIWIRSCYMSNQQYKCISLFYDIVINMLKQIDDKMFTKRKEFKQQCYMRS